MESPSLLLKILNEFFGVNSVEKSGGFPKPYIPIEAGQTALRRLGLKENGPKFQGESSKVFHGKKTK